MHLILKENLLRFHVSERSGRQEGAALLIKQTAVQGGQQTGKNWLQVNQA